MANKNSLLAISMGMGVMLVRLSMGGPTCVSYPDFAALFPADSFLEFRYLALGFSKFDIIFLDFSFRAVIENSKAGGIITAIFKTLQAIHEMGHDVAVADGTNDSTHVF